MKTCYKVVREKRGKYYSAIIDNPKLKVEYNRDKWIKPKIGKIFVFETKEQAIDFAKEIAFSSDDWYTVFKVQAIGVKKAEWRVPTLYSKHYEYIKAFWQKVGKVNRIKALPGTLFAKKIKLIEEV